MVEMTLEEFEDAVRDGLDLVPPDLAAQMDNVVVLVEDDAPPGDPELLAWALMGIGELVGMRWILWAGRDELPPDVGAELDRIVTRTLGSRNGST